MQSADSEMDSLNREMAHSTSDSNGMHDAPSTIFSSLKNDNNLKEKEMEEIILKHGPLFSVAWDRSCSIEARSWTGIAQAMSNDFSKACVKGSIKSLPWNTSERNLSSRSSDPNSILVATTWDCAFRLQLASNLDTIETTTVWNWSLTNPSTTCLFAGLRGAIASAICSRADTFCLSLSTRSRNFSWFVSVTPVKDVMTSSIWSRKICWWSLMTATIVWAKPSVVGSSSAITQNRRATSLTYS